MSSTATYTESVPIRPPLAGAMPRPAGGCPSLRETSMGMKRGFVSLWHRFSARKRTRSDKSSQRLQISTPTEFRHVYSETCAEPQFAHLEPGDPAARPRRMPLSRSGSLRSLQLNLHGPTSKLVPSLPHLDDVTMPATMPRASVQVQSNADGDFLKLTHEPKFSTMLFHLPRNMSTSPSITTASDGGPEGSPRPGAPSQTLPNTDKMMERIASAMLEVDSLQRKIDMVTQRQSIYATARPSTAHFIPLAVHDEEPLSPFHAMPLGSPSLADRLNHGVGVGIGGVGLGLELERPHTAPPRPPMHDTLATAPLTSSWGCVKEDRPPPPPLPLVLRPPLRKKKSFSRVSSWLSLNSTTGQSHQRSISRDSVTNFPRPVKGFEGFYQCVPTSRVRRSSADSASTVLTWGSEDGGQTVPTTTWSPSSNPEPKADDLPQLERANTNGKKRSAKWLQRANSAAGC